ncbi:MAG: ComEA family DNA-binding protein [Panacagrimonas sp.]
MRKLLAVLIFALCPMFAIAGPVNVNTADEKALEKELEGVGPKTAAEIVKERTNGQFKDSADLKKRVKGIGDKTIEKNVDNLKF